MNEGYIKFNCNLIEKKPLPKEELVDLLKWRQKLFFLGLIGAYPNGIGFGNISKRYNQNKFIITGSATGQLKELGEEHFVLVIEHDFEKNFLSCEGKINASSESLSHAAIYDSTNVNAVMHVHNKKLWDYLMRELPFTSKEIEYGTPEMANAIKKVIANPMISKEKIFAMGGHEEGVICFGENLGEAGERLLKWFGKIKS